MQLVRELNLLSILLRVTLSILLGGVLGIERGRKNRPAGLRTYMLVCLGATIVMMTNQYVFTYFGASDPTRLGAQVISGIGFLGAGTILTRNNSQVRGMTTAAGLWTAACGGLAIGIGFYEGALIGGIAIFLVMSVMQRLDVAIHNRAAAIEIYLEYESKRPLHSFLEFARVNRFNISNIQISKSKLNKGEYMSIILTAESCTHRTHTQMLEILGSAEGVTHIEEL